jgi:hypothetical protein
LVIPRGDLDCASVAPPHRDAEAMPDGSQVIVGPAAAERQVTIAEGTPSAGEEIRPAPCAESLTTARPSMMLCCDT